MSSVTVRPGQVWEQHTSGYDDEVVGDKIVVLEVAQAARWAGGGYASVIRMHGTLEFGFSSRSGESVAFERIAEWYSLVGSICAPVLRQPEAPSAPTPSNEDTELLNFLSSACQQIDLTMQIPMEQDTYSVSLKPCADDAPLNLRTAARKFRDIRNRYLS